MTLDEAALEIDGRGDGVLVFRDAVDRARQRALPARGREPRPDRARGLTRSARRAAGSAPAGPTPPPGGGRARRRRRRAARRGARRSSLDLAAGRGGLDHRIHAGARAAAGPRAHRLHRLHPLRARADRRQQRERATCASLRPRRRAAILDKLCRCRITCFVVTKGLVPPTELLEAAEARGIPVLTTPLESTAFIKLLSRVPRGAARHAAAPARGAARRVRPRRADPGRERDRQVRVRARPDRPGAPPRRRRRRRDASGWRDVLVGASPDLTRYHMELRGLGVLNIKDLYGVSSIRLSKRVELVVQLERWEAGKEYDRLGLRDETFLDPGRRGAARAHAGGPRAQHRAARRGGGAQPAPARGRLRRGAALRRAGRRDGGRRARAGAAPPSAAASGRGSGERGGAAAAAAARDHGPVGLGQDARLARARGRRLVLRRQPADRPRAVVRRSDPRLRRSCAARPSWSTCGSGPSPRRSRRSTGR